MNPDHLPPNDQWAPSVELTRHKPPSRAEWSAVSLAAWGTVGALVVTGAAIVNHRYVDPTTVLSAGSDSQRSYKLEADPNDRFVSAYVESDGMRQPAALVDSRTGEAIPESDRSFADLHGRTVTIVDVNGEGACSPSSLALSLDDSGLTARRVSTAATALQQSSLEAPSGTRAMPDFCF